MSRHLNWLPEKLIPQVLPVRCFPIHENIPIVSLMFSYFPDNSANSFIAFIAASMCNSWEKKNSAIVGILAYLYLTFIYTSDCVFCNLLTLGAFLYIEGHYFYRVNKEHCPKGSPCVIPLSTEKLSQMNPLFFTQSLLLLYDALIHCKKSS